MDSEKKRKLEAAGWRVGSTRDFLDLSDEEMNYIDFKLALSAKLKNVRIQKKMTQAELAQIVKSSQPRIAHMEKGDASVSIDLLLRSLFKLGVTREEITAALG